MGIESQRRNFLFTVFFVSGFCGLLYQVIWVRLAFASFGIITPVLSVVISTFMLGLALGSWLAGKVVSALVRRTHLSALDFYAGAEIAIGIGAFAVPHLFAWGKSSLLQMGQSNSFSYLLFSAISIGVSILPWCIFMGATFPLMMANIREYGGVPKSFSFLYLANVLGAMFGTLVTATVLIEVLGFRHSLWVAGTANLAIGAASIVFGRLFRAKFGRSENPIVDVRPAPRGKPPLLVVLLFTTGFVSLALEVIWTRAFTAVLGSYVYSFSGLLFVYLLGTAAGSFWYRRDLQNARQWPMERLLSVLSIVIFLPIVLNDPRIVHGIARSLVALLSVFPLCAVLGYLTPHLIDKYSDSDPRLAGKAYAVNVLGCILGPLFASYIMLPQLGAGISMTLLAALFLPLRVLGYAPAAPKWQRRVDWVTGVFLVSSLFFSISYEIPCRRAGTNCVVRRDYAATVVSNGTGMGKMLWVNGIGMTVLTPITKYMAHLPLAFHREKPESALIICFGMGTTFRSTLSWDVQTTAVELVPGVVEAFPYYHADAEQFLHRPNSRIVIDDGARFLDRTSETYDTIVLDPPPPSESVGSSLLYSTEFHRAVRRHLKPGGIFQTWFANGEELTQQAIARSLVSVFPYVKAYQPVEAVGLHFLASMSPIETLSPEEFLRRLPVAAKDDLMEWSRQGVEADVNKVLKSEVPISSLLSPHPFVEITEDHPYNEYFLMRRLTGYAIR